MGIRLSEHKSLFIHFTDDEALLGKHEGIVNIHTSKLELFESVVSKPFNDSSHCYLYKKKESNYELKADYCIGLDWLGETGRHLYVEPKINTRYAKLFDKKSERDPDDCTKQEKSEEVDGSIFELDYLSMLLQVTHLKKVIEISKAWLRLTGLPSPLKLNKSTTD